MTYFHNRGDRSMITEVIDFYDPPVRRWLIGEEHDNRHQNVYP